MKKAYFLIIIFAFVFNLSSLARIGENESISIEKMSFTISSSSVFLFTPTDFSTNNTVYNPSVPNQKLQDYFKLSYRAGIVYLSIISILIIFTLILWLFTFERIYLYYVLFLIFSLGVGLFNFILYSWTDYLSYNLANLHKRYLELTTLFGLSAYCFFSISLLNLQRFSIPLKRLIKFIAILSAFIGIIYWTSLSFIADYETIYFIITRILLLGFSIIALFWVGLKITSPFKLYFILGSILYFLGALLGVIRKEFPIIPWEWFYNISPSTYFQMGILLEIICFAFALGHRVFVHFREQHIQEVQQKELMMLERDSAYSQILATQIQSNTHFIFNSLNAIKLLIQKKATKPAERYLIVFSRFIRMILELPKQKIISLHEELQLIDYYLKLEQIRFNNELNYHLEVSLSEQDLQAIHIPPLLLQPFIENSIWHGLIPSNQEEKCLFIKIYQTNNITHILIEDNGVGRQIGTSTPDSLKDSKKSLGLKITKERIHLYNQNQPNQINFQIIDKVESSGTIIHIQLNNP